MKAFYTFLRFNILLIIGILLFSSCKLSSLTPDNEFIQYNNLSENINGTYSLNQEVNDSLYYPRKREFFLIFDLVKIKEKELLADKHFDQLTIRYDGKKRINFCFEGKGEEKIQFTYKCKPKGNYLEVYFQKRSIWALPLFMSYEYNRLRLGLDKNSNLIVHKWRDGISTLTIIPFDSRSIDYSHTLIRIHKDELQLSIK